MAVSLFNQSSSLILQSIKKGCCSPWWENSRGVRFELSVVSIMLILLWSPLRLNFGQRKCRPDRGSILAWVWVPHFNGIAALQEKHPEKGRAETLHSFGHFRRRMGVGLNLHLCDRHIGYETNTTFFQILVFILPFHQHYGILYRNFPFCHRFS
jgi:hypothetical protein